MLTRQRQDVRRVRATYEDGFQLGRQFDTSTLNATVGGDFRGLIVEKSWGWEYELFRNANASLWALQFHGGGSMSMHCHPRCESALLAIHGTVCLETLHESFDISQGEGVILAGGAFHRLSASADTIIVESLYPPWREDLVRVSETIRGGVASHAYLANAEVCPLSQSRPTWRLPYRAGGDHWSGYRTAIDLPDGTIAFCTHGTAEYQSHTLEDIRASPLGHFGVGSAYDPLSYSIPTARLADISAEYVSFSLRESIPN